MDKKLDKVVDKIIKKYQDMTDEEFVEYFDKPIEGHDYSRQIVVEPIKDKKNE